MVNFAYVGNRVPSKYFITHGAGESDAGSKFLPAETGSYDAALNDAGIENANIVKYTSVIPTEAKEISLKDGLKTIAWGEVLESIMSQTNGTKGQNISAGVMLTQVSDHNGNYLGGFACEYSGQGKEEDAKASLLKSVVGMIERRGYGTFTNPKFGEDNVTDKNYVIHPGHTWVWSDMKVTKRSGTVLAAVCFTEYKVPVMRTPSFTKKNKHKKHTRKR